MMSLSGATGAPRAAAAADEAERWYVIKIGGNPAGYVREIVEAKAAAQFKTAPAERLLVTTSEMRLVLNRLGSRIELRFMSEAAESAESGALLKTSYVMLASTQSTKSDAVVGDGKIEITSEAGGKSYTNILTFEGKLYGSEAVRHACAEGLKKPGDKIVIQTFVPEASLVGDLTRVVLDREDVMIEGQTVAAVKVEETFEGMPIKRTGWLDLEGNLLKQEEPGPFGIMEIVRVEKSVALASASGVELPAEIYQKSIVRTNIRLPRQAPIDRLKLRLAHRNPALGWPDFKSGNQTVIEQTEKELVLEMRRPAQPKDMKYPVATDADNRQFLEPNAYIQSDDPEIRRLARELAGDEKDAFQAALVMERWAAEHMTFDLGIVFAPATEVFKNRRGTCVGYATILATLARAAGIPSRVAMGYVYALGMFGGHAWAEIMAGKECVPLDAAIVNEGVGDAGHLTIVASSLAMGAGEIGIGPAQQIFGQVDIAILEYETAGKTTVVGADARPFLVEGNRYRNPWLGVEIEKPADFAFAKLDAIWPDPTVVGMTGPNGQKAALEEQPFYPWLEMPKAAAERLAKLVPGGKSGTLTVGERPGATKGQGKPDAEGSAEMGKNRSKEAEPPTNMKMDKQVPAIYASDGKTAAAAFGRGAVLYVLKAEGPDAPGLLRRLAAGLRLN
ncbi:MAG: hypothetical protein A2W03_09460 [Candidatus Aminicenantes bacterium RBG_16_63_16]|nr:MAG: hypothetical protein A2W03_09460 [Candidatus Aminicenantes bacterium RBG_16_63_16]